MTGKLERLIAGHSRDFVIFALSGVFLGLYSGLYDPTFNNYLNDVFNISEVARGALEFPRELPGFLVVFVSGLLLVLADTRMAFLATLVMAAGLFGQALFAPSFGWMMVWMVTWSMGTHLQLPLLSSIGVSLAEPDKVGLRLGQLTAINTGASVIGYIVVWVGFRYLHFNYHVNFAIAGVAVVLCAVCFWIMKPRKRESQKIRIVIKKKYSLFYLLNILFGARKQLFLTFGPWVLIKIFHQPVATFAMLGLIATILGVILRPALGKAIDSLGERKIIAFESFSLVFVCFIYGFANIIWGHKIGLILVYICFIIDQLLFAVSIARTTYLSKIADTPDDITPTLTMGITLDHAVAMTVPFFGGLLWGLFGYQYVFLAASAIAFINLFAASKIRTGLSSGSAGTRPEKSAGYFS